MSISYAIKTAREVIRPKKNIGGEAYNAQLLGKVGKGTEDQMGTVVTSTEPDMSSKLKDHLLEEQKEKDRQAADQSNWSGGGEGDGTPGGLGDAYGGANPGEGGGYGGYGNDSSNAGGSPAGDGGGTAGGAMKRGGATDKGSSAKVKPHVGPIHSPVSGRTDHLPMHVKSGSYVIPADIISAMGEGNTMSGFKNAKMLFGGQAYKQGVEKAFGGPATDGELVPIIAAGGEYVIGPENVMVIGGGDLDYGHKILDSFVKKMRAKTISTLKKLPGPKKD